MFKLVTITLLTLVMSIAANNPHAEKSTSTADTTSSQRVLVSPKTNFTLFTSDVGTSHPSVVLEVWSERMISGNAVAPAAAEGHRLLNEHGESAEGAGAAPAMSYTYRVNGKLYLNDQNLYKNGANGKVSYQVKIGFMDKSYTTVNGPLNKDSTPAIDWALIKYDATDKSDDGTWVCEDRWTDYTKPVVKALADVTQPKWSLANTLDDKQNCNLVKSFNSRNVKDDSHLYLTAQFNRLFDTLDLKQDIKLWSGMPITLVTQVSKDLQTDTTKKGAYTDIKQFDYQFTDFAIYDHVEHDSSQVTIIIILLIFGSFGIIGTCWFLENRGKK